jgi:putative transposase
MELKSTRHAKYLCNYHFILYGYLNTVERYLLINEVAKYLKYTLKSITEELCCKVIAMEVMQDHIHLFIRKLFIDIHYLT